MEDPEIHPASEAEKEMAAHLLAGSEPWLTLGISFEQCRKNCYDPEFNIYFAYSGNKPAGVIIVDPRGVAGSPYIKSIAVFPESRGKGVGTRLISFAEQLFRGKSKFMFICVSSFNDKAGKLYRSLGYEFIGELRDYIIEGASEMLLCKKL
jgi:ribosomal protein S18 acetylase RimI-like enzyme